MFFLSIELNEEALVNMHIGIMAILGIALSIVVSHKAALFFTSFGFLIYLSSAIGLLFLLMYHTLGIIANPLRYLHDTRKSIAEALSTHLEKEKIEEIIKDAMGPESYELRLYRLNSAYFAVSFPIAFFVPLPWILSTETNESLMKQNISDFTSQASILLLFTFLFLVVTYSFRQTFPINIPPGIPKLFSSYATGLVLIPKFVAIQIAIISYLRLDLIATFENLVAFLWIGFLIGVPYFMVRLAIYFAWKV